MNRTNRMALGKTFIAVPEFRSEFCGKIARVFTTEGLDCFLRPTAFAVPSLHRSVFSEKLCGNKFFCVVTITLEKEFVASLVRSLRHRHGIRLKIWPIFQDLAVELKTN